MTTNNQSEETTHKHIHTNTTTVDHIKNYSNHRNENTVIKYKNSANKKCNKLILVLHLRFPIIHIHGLQLML